MSRKGSGSKLSPIAIDDSEDEVTQELCEVNLDSSSPLHPRPGPSTNHKESLARRRTPPNDMSNRREGGDVGGKIFFAFVPRMYLMLKIYIKAVSVPRSVKERIVNHTMMLQALVKIGLA
jgi:hypothetical protein